MLSFIRLLEFKVIHTVPNGKNMKSIAIVLIISTVIDFSFQGEYEYIIFIL